MALNYIVKPSLEHIALVKVAAILWNQIDIKDLIASSSFPSHYSKLRVPMTDQKLTIEKEIKEIWDVIEGRVVRKVVDLPLPQLLKDKISIFIKVVGLKILKWMVFIYQSCGLELNLPNKFYWTPKGTVDELKTAKIFINDQSIDIATRYKLSCIYCSQNDILKIWNEMSEDCRNNFYDEEDPINVDQHELVIVWTYDIKGEIMDKLDMVVENAMGFECSPYEYAFCFASTSGNKVATEYFLQKLEPDEKKQCLIYAGRAAACGISDLFENRHGNRGENYTEVLCALLSKMDKKQQIEVFKTHPSQVLCCLLDWPFQDFFMNAANCMWSFLSKTDFVHCLKKILLKMDCKDYDYKELLKIFWNQSRDSHKRYLSKCLRAAESSESND